MRFLCTYRSESHGKPDAAKDAAIMQFAEEMTRAGVLLDTGGIVPISRAPRAKLSKGKFTVTDGPFPETKELISGYAIIQAKSLDDAAEVFRRFMAIAGDGEGEIQQLMSAQDEPHG
jgi:hypothetical protein